MRVLALDPFCPIIISKHADRRISERVGADLDQARDEIKHGIVRGDVEHRARNIYYVTGPDRVYVVAAHRRPTPVLVVVTVLTPLVAVAA